MSTATAIETILIRDGGSFIELGGIEYHFKPYTDGAHVCDVENTEHADRFLSIPEGYRLYRGPGLPLGLLSAPAFAAAKAAATKAAAAPEILLGGDFPAVANIHGVDYQLGTVIAQAHAKSGLSVADWNALSQDARDDIINEEFNAIDEAGPATPQEAAEHDERAALVAEYIQLVGKKPHYNVGIEKLHGMIEAERENAAKRAAEQK